MVGLKTSNFREMKTQLIVPVRSGDISPIVVGLQQLPTSGGFSFHGSRDNPALAEAVVPAAQQPHQPRRPPGRHGRRGGLATVPAVPAASDGGGWPKPLGSTGGPWIPWEVGGVWRI